MVAKKRLISLRKTRIKTREEHTQKILEEMDEVLEKILTEYSEKLGNNLRKVPLSMPVTFRVQPIGCEFPDELKTGEKLFEFLVIDAEGHTWGFELSCEPMKVLLYIAKTMNALPMVFAYKPKPKVPEIPYVEEPFPPIPPCEFYDLNGKKWSPLQTSSTEEPPNSPPKDPDKDK